MFYNKLYSHAILAATWHDDVCILHGGLYELLEGLHNNRHIIFRAITIAGLTGLTNLLYCFNTPSRSLPLSDISLRSLW